MRRLGLLAAVLAMVAAACGDDDAVTTTTTTVAPVTTTTTTTVPASTTTTTTFPPEGAVLASEGDRNETVAAMQAYLNCSGESLEVDGAFGPISRAALEAAQERFGRRVTGVLDEPTMADLARACFEPRVLEPGDEPVVAVGNAAPGDPEFFLVSVLSRRVLTVTTTDPVMVSVADSDGQQIEAASDGAWEIAEAGDYLIEVGSDADAVTFTVEVGVTEGVASLGAWIIETDGLRFGDVELSLGDDAQTVIDTVLEILGHGVRGAYNEFDTGWYVITEPQELGLRGVFIEGFAMLFFGPHPSDPDRPETWVRLRFEGPSDDAEGEPRPDDYATTAAGVTVGDTLADLQAAYGSEVSAGSNADEHYYRYSDSGGVLCFYFGPDAPSASTPITEIATECRS